MEGNLYFQQPLAVVVAIVVNKDMAKPQLITST